MSAKINDKIYKRKIKKLLKFVKKRLPKKALQEFKANTPKESGFARRNTKLKESRRKFTITGDYDYSGVLDRGLYPNPPKAGTGKTSGGYSKKAPDGMVKPTSDFVDKEIKKYIRRI
tara:strand:+ start:1938 stop:2288 length:351 start_codon:yes stop_codon:yes gene_type:complete